MMAQGQKKIKNAKVATDEEYKLQHINWLEWEREL